MKKKKPHYSGDASKDFWRRVNAIKGPDFMGLYALGCVLQTAEHHALAALEEAEEKRRSWKARQANCKDTRKRGEYSLCSSPRPPAERTKT